MRLLSELEGGDEHVNEMVNKIINQPFGDKAIGVLDIWNYDAKKWDKMRLKLGELIQEAK